MSGSRTLFCHVTTATCSFAIIYLVGNLLELVDVIRVASSEKSPYGIPYKPFPRAQRIFDISTSILMLLLMGIAAFLVLLSKRKGPTCVLPFVLMLLVDLGLSFLSLFHENWGLPGTATYKDVLAITKYYNKITKFDEEDLARFTMMYSVVFILNILLKVYILQVSIRCYYFLKAEMAAGIHVDAENIVTVKLPSYDEALKMKAEDTPPTYQET